MQLHIHRLHYGNSRIFEPSERILNLNSSNCRAPKIIFNDAELEPVSWELRIENTRFNFCVGVEVGGHDVTNFSYISKGAQENFTSFDTTVTTRGCRGKWFCMKNRPKIEITGVEIAWAKPKSKSSPIQ